jgi:small subunit ribosomal protein S7
VLPDPVYQNPLVTQLINKVLLHGKKTVAESTVYKALEIISERTANDPVITLKKAVENVRPMLEVKSRRVGGASYQVPVEVKPQRGTTLALRWLVNYSRARRENSMAERLVAEIMDASSGTGTSVKRREDMHKMAEANKAFAHYRW